ncbi:MAG: adenine deaminase, partial [Alphaproteobacteria bacterium]|nr:adenine deaminase [Alphaproteobacteria bacterium]
LMHPFEFERCTLPHGTTTVIADPHEITNVLGKKGFAWILRCAERMHQNLFVQVSSCVPSVMGLETNGGTFTLKEMSTFKKHPNVLGLAEMMNVPGVIHGDPDVLAKLDAFDDRICDGHAPMVCGLPLNAYRLCGIANCHESVSRDEARQKLQYGMAVMLREGSAAKNLDDLASIVNSSNAHTCLLCTDDRNPLDIFEEGHIDAMVRRLIQKHNLPIMTAYAMSSYNTAKHFGLKRLGLIAPGYQADFSILSNLENVMIEDVYCKGQSIKTINTAASQAHKFEKSKPPLFNSINRAPVTPDDLHIPLEKGVYRVIQLIPDSLITNEKHVRWDGDSFDDDDVLPMNVLERYGKNQPAAKGLVMGVGLKGGAIATSIAHDCHNLIVIGEKATDRAVAVNRLIQMGGGIVAVQNETILSELALPLAGLLSLESSGRITAQLGRLRDAAKALGCTLHEPYLQMAFLALPVIPHLKLTDRGLVQYDDLRLVSLRVMKSSL